jgi:peptidoglycan/xylan/chitin deacetylase (PgdA/CDA1 family)
MQYSFLCNSPFTKQAALEQLARDARRAKLSTKFRAYYFLRPFIPLALRQMLQRNRQIPINKDWYIPDAFMKRLVSSVEKEPATIRIIHPWPHGHRFGFVLTHDVETKAGLRNILRLANIEQELGFRSSWNLIPHKYKIDQGLVNELQARSFEIGIHGYNHDGRLYLSQRLFERRGAAINRAIDKYQAVGFRSPMVHRNLDWLQSLDVEYDASCFDVDPFQAMPGGVGSIWPFVVGRFVELPYTLPQDHTLFVVLGEQNTRIWEHKLEYLSRHNGMALMLTHPDYLDSPRLLDLYRRFLARVREHEDNWHALPREVAAWWMKREQSHLEACPFENWKIDGPASEMGAVATVEVHDRSFSLQVAARETSESHTNKL